MVLNFLNKIIALYLQSECKQFFKTLIIKGF